MSDIYDLLPKHFLKETSEEEEKQIEKFAKEHAKEYKLLTELWSHEDIKPIDFDSVKAWQIVHNKASRKEFKHQSIRPLIRRYLQIASVAAVLILGSISAYYLIYTQQNPKMILAKTLDNKKSDVIVLSDGTKIWLNKNATIHYPQTFGSDERRVILTGEAYFEVSKNPNKPFIVEASNANIKVLGTSFDINTKHKNTMVSVNTGRVEVSNADKSSNVIITKGYSANVENNHVNKFDTNNPNYLSWKTGEFTFDNTDITEVISLLNSYYSKQIALKNTTDTTCSLTAHFKKLKLQEVIEIIELTCDIDVVYLSENKIDQL